MSREQQENRLEVMRLWFVLDHAPALEPRLLWQVRQGGNSLLRCSR